MKSSDAYSLIYSSSFYIVNIHIDKINVYMVLFSPSLDLAEYASYLAYIAFYIKEIQS